MTTLTTLIDPKAWGNDVVEVPPQEVIPDALILTTSTVAGSIEGDSPAVRVPYVDDDLAGFVAEGLNIPEGDPTLAEAVVHTGKISQLIRLSREQFLQPNAEKLLQDSVGRAVLKAGNVAYIQQVAPVSPATTPPAGLLNVSGITAGGVIEASLDGLLDLQAALAESGAVPTHVVVSPTAWADLRRIKDETGSARSLLGFGTSDTAPLLLNVPVLVSNAVPTGTGLILDRTAIVSAVSQVMVAVSYERYFESDSIGIRATWRIGLAVVKPSRIGYFTTTSGDLS